MRQENIYELINTLLNDILLHEIDLVTNLVVEIRKKYQKEFGLLDVKIIRHVVEEKQDLDESEYNEEDDSIKAPSNLGRKIGDEEEQSDSIDEIEEIFNRPELKFMTIQKNLYLPERDLRDATT